MGDKVMGFGYSDRKRDGDEIPLLTFLNLLAAVLVIIFPKRGNRKNVFFSSPRLLLLFDRVVEAEADTEGSGEGRRREKNMIEWRPIWTGIG